MSSNGIHIGLLRKKKKWMSLARRIVLAAPKMRQTILFYRDRIRFREDEVDSSEDGVQRLDL